MSSDCPRARSEGLITEELDGELLVYDSESNLAHALDPEAAALWRACDGHTDSKALAVCCATTHEHVQRTLARLGELGLLEVDQADQDGDTRRDALRKIGIAGVGVATISSVLVPIAAAGSCVQPGNCVFPGQTCCTGHPEAFFMCGGPAGNVCCAPAGTCAPPRRIPQESFCCPGTTQTRDNSCPDQIRCT